MGLDQYAEFRAKPLETATFSWRKHAALQEHMERLWVEKTGQSASTLNCQDMSLTANDIEELRKAILSGFKDCRSDGGYFYGHEFQDESVKEYREEDLQFCHEAMKAIERGETVIYSCWW